VARKHSKFTVILINGIDISSHCTDSTCEESGATEDLTTYGKNKIVRGPALGDGAFSCSGKYDDSATGPRAVLKPLVNTLVTVTYRPEGTGAGLPQDVFSAVLTKYTETAPVAGYRTWAIETDPSDAWNSTAQ
jgi:hypothetical protein